MPTYMPEEVDVFKIPHSRMKDLVNNYFEMLQSTNFSSTVDLELLLESLGRTFCEFRCHEMIENQFIMKKLKSKLKKLSISDSAVCNCHKDSRLKSILSLVQDGFSKKTQQDRINYGLQLKKELQDFTATFLPHMEEEEEVFQPMLEQYFSYEELKELKERVIQQHLQPPQHLQHRLESFLGSRDKEHSSSSSDSDEEESLCQQVDCAHLTPASDKLRETMVTDLPPEVTLKVFSLLSPRDLGRCAQVCKDWSGLAMQPLLWQVVQPIRWAEGDWTFNDVCGGDVDEPGEEELQQDEDDAYVVLDEDADIDEAEDTGAHGHTLHKIQAEAGILIGLSKHVLPKVGQGVLKLVLAHSKSLTNALLKKMLLNCPNLERLDLSQTRISDDGINCAGKNGSCSHLKYLSLSGCVNITDATLLRLAMAFSRPDVAKDTTKYNNDEPVTKQLVPPAGCLFEEYYQTYGQRLTGDSVISTGCGNSLEVDSPTNIGGTPHNKCDIAYDEDKDIDEVAMVTERAVDPGSPADSCDGERTFEPEADHCHSACVQTQEQTGWLAIEDCYKVKAKPVTPLCGLQRAKRSQTAPLQHLNLSGCFQVTDLGLRALARCADFQQLTTLDLSGCLKVTGPGLMELVKLCPNLQHEELYYCDNIIDGPFSETASGCRNLQCSNRVCCRSGF